MVTGLVFNHFRSISTSVYFSSIISHGKASWNVCVGSVSQYNTQLQPAASLIAIPTSKPTIGNKSRRAIITEVITPDVTFVLNTLLSDQTSWIWTQDAPKQVGDCPKLSAGLTWNRQWHPPPYSHWFLPLLLPLPSVSMLETSMRELHRCETCR